MNVRGCNASSGASAIYFEFRSNPMIYEENALIDLNTVSWVPKSFETSGSKESSFNCNAQVVFYLMITQDDHGCWKSSKLDRPREGMKKGSWHRHSYSSSALQISYSSGDCSEWKFLAYLLTLSIWSKTRLVNPNTSVLSAARIVCCLHVTKLFYLSIGFWRFWRKVQTGFGSYAPISSTFNYYTKRSISVKAVRRYQKSLSIHIVSGEVAEKGRQAQMASHDYSCRLMAFPGPSCGKTDRKIKIILLNPSTVTSWYQGEWGYEVLAWGALTGGCAKSPPSQSSLTGQ